MKKLSAYFVLGLLLIFGIEPRQTYAAVRETKNTAFQSYSLAFNDSEIFHTDITPFYKWTKVLRRMDAHKESTPPWLENKESLERLSAWDRAQKVDHLVNKYGYVSDMRNWGVTDYWEIPAEFFKRGGDCEDFALTKYAWLRSLATTEDNLRIAVVHDRVRNMPHAVLLLYINNKAMILDNQVKDIRDSSTTSRYRMIYSINRQGWWRPMTRFASAEPRVEEDMDRMEPASGGDDLPFSKACFDGADLPECINSIEPSAR
ncbi:MAG: hypothetical protein AUJ12_04560 [Alphaproteobacteria bacterium CG1_02_46_17]|nr:MAG: hypothetical protein AUJ12_04560 [Alphaproteobacteria bacterium CG1_02_46_17]